MNQFDPKDNKPTPMSAAKRDFWNGPFVSPSGITTCRLAVFHYAMNSTVRPTDPSQTIAYGYVQGNKLHDREPELLVQVILAQDPNFFDSYPRKPGAPVTMDLMKTAVSDAARAFYRHGMPAYGKPGLRVGGNILATVFPVKGTTPVTLFINDTLGLFKGGYPAQRFEGWCNRACSAHSSAHSRVGRIEAKEEAERIKKEMIKYVTETILPKIQVSLDCPPEQWLDENGYFDWHKEIMSLPDQPPVNVKFSAG